MTTPSAQSVSPDHAAGLATPRSSKPFIKRAAQLIAFIVILMGVYFGVAGRLDLPTAWALFGVYFLNILVLMRIVDPGLIKERGRTKQPMQSWDKKLLSIYALTTPLTMIVAALDAGRFGWSLPMPASIPIAALVLFTLSLALVGWAMTSNRFFSKIVRIQTDRGHAVVSSGPYRWVRHPGYVGMALLLLSMPIALGSLWAMIPGGIGAAVIVIRAGFEDRFLQASLDGYRDYAAKVRYRLLPGVW